MSGSNQISFPRSENEVIVAAYPEGILIIYGWTMSVTLSKVKQYIKNFGRNSQKDIEEGFFLHDRRLILSHSGAKMTFSSDEASAIINFLTLHYKLPQPDGSSTAESGSVKGQMS